MGRRNNKIQDYPVPKTCTYCGQAVKLVNNDVIYGRSYGSGRCYKCTACDAYVGVHAGTTIPLGRLANQELRALKKQAHALFDPQWKTGRKTRSQAYGELANTLGIPARECHFGWFDKETLERAIAILKKNAVLLPPVDAMQLMKDVSGVLRTTPNATDEWGRTFLTGIIQKLRRGESLSETQLAKLEEQHMKIMRYKGN